MRYREVCYDILTDLKKTKDDSNIELYQVLYWVCVVANKLNRDNYAISNSGLHLTIFPSVSVQIDTTLHNRKYIELPAQIFDLPNEEAVEYLTYNHDLCDCAGPNFGLVSFEPITAATLHMLEKSSFTKPKPNRPYFYRSLNKLYLRGIEDVDVTDLEIGLFTALDPRNIADLDTEIPLPDEALNALIKEVLNLGRFLSLVPEDRGNTGDEESEGAPLVRNVQQSNNQQTEG